MASVIQKVLFAMSRTQNGELISCAARPSTWAGVNSGFLLKHYNSKRFSSNLPKRNDDDESRISKKDGNEGADSKDGEVESAKSLVRKAIDEVLSLDPAYRAKVFVYMSPSDLENGNVRDILEELRERDQSRIQSVMQEPDFGRRLNIAAELLGKAKEVLGIRSDIDKSVNERLAKNFREHHLREWLKAIQKELGMDDKQSLSDKVDEKLKGLIVPEYAMKVIKEEQAKLAFLDSHSAEFSITRNYVDWLINIPWGSSTDEDVDLERAEKILNEDHYGMKDVKDRILEFIAVRILKKKTSGKILCFHGPPGVGKTSIAKSIARVLGRKYYRFSVGGLTDVAEIKGHRRTYVGAMPGKMIQCLKKVETENPVVLIDEIDKIGTPGFHGDPSAALLELLDPEQNSNFMDHFLDVPVDLSKVLFICTANVTDDIPNALVDRMELIEVSGYVAEEKLKIAENYLIPQCREACALPEDKLAIRNEGIKMMIKSYCRESGVRNLQKNIEKIFRKSALQIARAGKPSSSATEADAGNVNSSVKEETRSDIKTAEPIVIDEKNLSKFLGCEKYLNKRMFKATPPGVIAGLAWTRNGGEVMYMEAVRRMKKQCSNSEDASKDNKSDAKGSLETTGQLGGVMKESTEVAYTVAKNMMMKRAPDNEFMEMEHIHLHFPEAMPKDGPSAGIAATSALVSLALDRPATQNIALTGEVSLTGKVLPVGGIREKVIGAKEAEMNTVILPEENLKDFEELPDFIKENVKVHYVSHYDQVYDLLFPEKSSDF